MNVEEIVKTYLRANGFDGLWTTMCGCSLDNLMPHGECGRDCVPGYRVKNEDGEWITVAEKPGEKDQPAPHSLHSPWSADE